MDQPNKNEFDAFQIFVLSSSGIMIVAMLIFLFGIPSVQVACNLLLVAVVALGLRISYQLSVLRR